MISQRLQHKIHQLFSSDCQNHERILHDIAGVAQSEGIRPIELIMQLGRRALEVSNLTLGHRLGDEVVSRSQHIDFLFLADAYMLKAYLHFMEEEWLDALQYFTKALQTMTTQGHRAGVARILDWAGDVYARARGGLIAAQLLKRAAKIHSEVGDVGAAAKAAFKAARAYFNEGYFQLSIEYCSRAEPFAIQSKRSDLRSKVQALAEEAADSFQHFKQQSGAHFQSLLTSEEGVLFKSPLRVSDTFGMGIVRLRTDIEHIPEFLAPEGGSSDYKMHEYEYLRHAYELFVILNDHEGMAFCLFQQSKYYGELQDYTMALPCYRSILDLLAGVGSHPFAEAAVYEKMGAHYLNTGEYRDAIEYNVMAAKIDQQIGDVEGEAMCYTNIGVSLYRLGESRQAIEFHRHALALTELQKAPVYNNLGTACLALKDYPSARDYYEKALREFNSSIDLYGRAQCLGNLAIVASREGKFGEAIKFNENALSLGNTWGDNPRIQATCNLNMGELYYLRKEHAKAFSSSQAAERIAKQIGRWDIETKALMVQAHVYNDQNELQAAYSTAKQALELADAFGARIEEEHFKLNVSEECAEDFRLIVDLCMRLGKTEEAYHYVEKSKSQSLVDLLSVTELNPTVELNQRISELLAEEGACLAKLRQVRTGATTGQEAVLDPGEMDAIRARLLAIHCDLANYDPEYVSFRRRAALSYTEIRQLLANKRASSNDETPIALIEYFVGTEKIHIFVIDANGDLHVQSVPLGQERFELLLENYTREVMLYRSDDFVMNTWQDLGMYLLDPIEKYIQAKAHLYIIPHNFLHFLPFHALRLNGDFLIRRHTVAYAPNASVLKFLLRKGRDRLEHCIAFGVALDSEDERALAALPRDRQSMHYRMRTVFELEAREVSDLFEGQCLTGSQVTQESVRQGCAGKDLVHFSCHGWLDGKDPLESGLKLYNGMLTTRQIFNLKLDAELVTLSACQTGMNWRRAGDDLLGLTRAFLYAGAASLLVTLWPVNSESTREFMANFYRRLKKGDDKATALQQAQLHQMERYQNPFYWAPFLLVGDWKV